MSVMKTVVYKVYQQRRYQASKMTNLEDFGNVTAGFGENSFDTFATSSSLVTNATFN